MKAPSEPAEQRRVGAVADGLAGGVRARGQLQPDHRKQAAHHRDRNLGRAAALDPAHLGSAQPHGAADLGLAQSSIGACPPELDGELGDHTPRLVGAMGSRTGPRSHGAIIRVGRYLAVIRPMSGRAAPYFVVALPASGRDSEFGGSPGSAPVAMGMPDWVQSL